MPEIIFKNKRIAFNDMGQGTTVVLLHGYLETKAVWENFAEKLAKQFRVIAPDIPGHGQSETIDAIHTMSLMAEAINYLLSSLKIEKYSIVGHSMGAYVMLAFADLFPEKLNKIVLFHSSIYADTDEKKHNRQREIDFIKLGKLDLIVNTNLPNTFATDNLLKFEPEIAELKEKAKTHASDGVCALLQGMMQRPNRIELIKNFEKPMLFIFGKKDNYIPVSAAEKMLSTNPAIQAAWLENSGHMGFIEEHDKALNIVVGFLKS